MLKTPRSRKCNKEQMQMIIDFLENNRILVNTKTHPLNIEEAERKWDELVSYLNEVENGARKTKKQWKTFLYEWKSKTKKKAKINKENITKTGGGGYHSENLTEMENRILSIFGWIHIMGLPEAAPEVDPDHQEVDIDLIDLQEVGDFQEVVPMVVPDDINYNAELEQSTSGEKEVIHAVPQPGTSKGRENELKKQKRNYNSSSKILENSAASYCESTEQLALAIKELASAISLFAKLLNNLE